MESSGPLHHLTCYFFNPFCVKGSKIRIIVEGIEDGRGLKVAKKLVETLHDSVLYTSATENGDHVFESNFQVPAHTNCLKITVSLSISVTPSQLTTFLIHTYLSCLGI